MSHDIFQQLNFLLDINKHISRHFIVRTPLLITADDARPANQHAVNLITGNPAGLCRVNGDGQCSTTMVNFNHSPKSQL